MTPEQIHDALNLLPSDLITEADKFRANPRKAPIRFRGWMATAACAALVLMLGSFAMQNFLPDMAKTTESIAEAPAAAAPEAPNAPAPMDIPAEMQQEAADMETKVLTPTGEPEAKMEEAPADEALGEAENSLCLDAGIDLDTIQYIATPVLPAINTAGDPRTSLVASAGALYDYYVKYCEVFYMDDYFAATVPYDRAWFLENDLLILRIGAPHPEFHYDVTAFTRQPDTEPAAWQITLARNPDEPTDIAFDNNSMWHILIPVPKGMLAEDAVILIDFA